MSGGAARSAAGFQARLLAWQAAHGRHDLPWQRPATPYRVWVSEVMLQQTQVATVIPYFERFMARYPEVGALAAAELDAVLSLWAGLGYYARARHLHAAARRIVAEHGGELPRDLATLQALPGIGRSTAGAIRSLGHRRPAAILDGNARRVLARFHGVAGWPGRSAVARELWRLAERYTPEAEAPAYNQALMDLGALVCTPRRPACDRCPVAEGCRAHAAGDPEAYPGRRPPRRRPLRRTRFLLLRSEQGVLLERRPPSGIWGGLWSLPEADPESDAEATVTACGVRPRRLRRHPERRHAFTHFELAIEPVEAWVDGGAVTDRETLWYKGEPGPALAAPVARLLEDLFSEERHG